MLILKWSNPGQLFTLQQNIWWGVRCPHGFTVSLPIEYELKSEKEKENNSTELSGMILAPVIIIRIIYEKQMDMRSSKCDILLRA